MAEHRNARVEIGVTDKGRPSVKIDGVEHNMLIGQEITLRHVPDDNLGHWELAVVFMEPHPSAKVSAALVGVDEMAAATAELREANKRLREIRAAIVEGLERANKANRRGGPTS